MLKKLYSKNWVVYAKPPFGGPEPVPRYPVLRCLARYTHRIAISNSRITELTADSVTFSYRDAKDESKLKPCALSHCTPSQCTLSHLEFTRRFLQHVPPKAFVRIRYYGFLAHAKKAKLLPKIRFSLEDKQRAISARATSRGFKYPDFKSQAIKPFDSS